jgi:hypothetical protein
METKEQAIRAIAIPDQDDLTEWGLSYDEWQEERAKMGLSVWRRK